MLTHLLAAYRRLFTSRVSRAEVAGLVLVMAAVPVVEMLVLRMFSDLIIEGPQLFADNRDAVVRDSLVFFALFALARAAHHGIRIYRVSVFRKRFDESAVKVTPSQESWNWALAFELSNVLANVVQIVAFTVLFLFLDLITGGVNLLVCALVLAAVSVFYRRQLVLQRDYVKMGSKPGTVAISERVGGRIRTAETGAFLGSVGMAVVLAVVLLRTLQGQVSGGEAIVFFLALRLLYGQVSILSSGIMRFARASSRTGAPT